jgi:hypothetical protein
MDLKTNLADWRHICERHHFEPVWFNYLLFSAEQWKRTGNARIDQKLAEIRFHAHIRDMAGAYGTVLELQSILASGMSVCRTRLHSVQNAQPHHA